MQGPFKSQILGLEDFSVVSYVKCRDNAAYKLPEEADLLCDEAHRTIAVMKLQIKNTL
jgi:hypothetical protein